MNIDPASWIDEDDPDDDAPIVQEWREDGNAIQGCVYGLALTAACGGALWWLLAAVGVW